MKKNLIKTIVVFFVLLCLCVGFCACDFGGSGAKETTSYKITIDKSYGISGSEFISSTDNTIIEPTYIPQKTGYDFVGWYSDANCTKELAYGTVLSSDLTIYAKWKKKEFTVSFVDELTERTPQTVEYGGKLVLETSPVMAGYDFGGYFTDENKTTAFDSDNLITSNLTIYYKWTPTAYSIVYHTADGVLPEDAVQSYTMIDGATLPTTCTKTGFVFEGWYEKSDFSGTKVTAIAKDTTGNKVFYAKYLCDQNAMNIKSGSGVTTTESGAFSLSVRYDRLTVSIGDYFTFSDKSTYIITDSLHKTVTAITLTQNDSEETVDYSYTVTVSAETGKEATYTFLIKQYTQATNEVRFHHTEASPETVVNDFIAGGDTAKVPVEPTPNAGYEFLYWATKDGENYTEYIFDTVVTAELDLYSRFSAIEYTITYSIGYGKNATENVATYTVEDEVVLQNAVPSYSGYTFVGWFDGENNKVETIDAGTTGNIALSAVYALVTDTIPDFAGETEIDEEEFQDYVMYLFANRIETATITVKSDKNGDQIGEFISKTIGDVLSSEMVDGINGHTCELDSDNSRVSGNPGSWTITLPFSYSGFATDKATAVYTQVQAVSVHYSTGREEEYSDFAIDHIQNTFLVKDSEQLVFAVERGYRPVFEKDSAVETLYNKAKAVARSIIQDTMTDKEKALAFYDYIISEVIYDHDVFKFVTDHQGENVNVTNYKCFYLEGVFDDKLAVCDGISKAYMLLCRIEGIPAIQVEGTKNGDGTGHAWNKIFISDGTNASAWYIVDCTSGNVIGGDNEYLSHRFFMITDAEMGKTYTETNAVISVTAETAYDYFGGETFTYETLEYSYAISTDAQMSALLNYAFQACDTAQNTVSVECHFVQGEGETVYTPFAEGNCFKSEVTLGSSAADYSISWLSLCEEETEGGAKIVYDILLVISPKE